ncbi:hypothetical protein HK101_006335, partial [Irineochytrium annulatum]
MLVRCFGALLLAAVFDAAACVMEERVAGFDYVGALKEFKEHGLNATQVAYTALNLTTVVGNMILADAGPFLIGMTADTTCYNLGRK